MNRHPYAVIDLETTGFNARGRDRVVEVGVALLRHDLTVEGTWSSVINPERDLGAVAVHGLTGAACVHAPTFSQIAKQLLEVLDGRILASHNWSFDAKFLSAEVARVGPVWFPEGLCTMKIAGQVGLPRTLDGATAELGLSRVGDVHGALEDALLAAAILRSYHDEVASALPAPSKSPHVQVTSSRTPVPREIAAPGAKRRLPRSLVPGLDEIPWPQFSGQDEDAVEEYCALLLDVLGDGEVSHSEVKLLKERRENLKIDGPIAGEIHKAIFEGARRLAWADDKLMQWEKESLSILAAHLGVEYIERKPDEDGVAVPASLKDQTIVFTGESTESRADLESLAYSAGATVKGSVSKSTTLVVAADPTTLSGKGRRARELGVSIISVKDFLNALKQ
jgi:DNA polymerase-3 subunit epsilon